MARYEGRRDRQPCRICPEDAHIIAIIGGYPCLFCSKTHELTYRALATGSGGGLKKKSHYTLDGAFDSSSVSVLCDPIFLTSYPSTTAILPSIRYHLECRARSIISTSTDILLWFVVALGGASIIAVLRFPLPSPKTLVFPHHCRFEGRSTCGANLTQCAYCDIKFMDNLVL